MVFFIWKAQKKVPLEIHSVENVEIRYCWIFFPLKRLKKGTVADLFNRKYSNKAEDLFYWNGQTKVRLGICSTEKFKIRYGWEFIPLKMLKKHTVGDLFHWKGHNKVRQGIYSIEAIKLKYGWGFVLLKRLKYGASGNSFNWKG